MNVSPQIFQHVFCRWKVLLAINPKLNEAAELINKDPNGEAWIMEIVIPETDKQNGLLDAKTYRKMVE